MSNQEKTVRWGIIGLGKIANTFAQEMNHVPDGKIVAVGSRSQQKADEFAVTHQIARAYGSYSDLAADPNVDIVYIATPHPEHKENALLCLRAGKAVLCEKSFTVNAAELEELIAVARQHNVFLMEAMWTRYLPAMQKVREWLTSGVIGSVRMVDVQFGNRAMWDPNSRLFKPALGGGALLDIGIYCVSFISMVYGGESPAMMKSLVNLAETGVDEGFTALFGYEAGQMASIMAHLRLRSKHEAVILGTEGEIRISDFWQAKSAELTVYGKHTERFLTTSEVRGYSFEITEAINCLRQGVLESAIMPLSESLSIMQTMDALRQEWGVKYPSE